MVTAALIMALAAWSDRPALPVVIALVAFGNPAPALIGAAAWAVYQHRRSSREPTPDEEARFLAGIASEARGGASPRQAIIRAAAHESAIDTGAAVRAARLGLGSVAVARALAQMLPLNGRLAGAAWAISTEVGAPFVPVMAVLADRASGRGRLRRERRALTAQARATAWIVAGLPILLVVILVATGRMSLGNSWSIAAVGLGLQVIGVGLVVLMLRSQR